MLQDREQRAERVMYLANQLGAIQTGHFEYASGQHGDTYFAKKTLLTNPAVSNELIQMMAEDYLYQGIDAVVGPETGGAMLAQLVADRLSLLEKRNVAYVPAAKDNHGGFTFAEDVLRSVQDGLYLITEDVLNTGGSALKTITLVRSLPASIIGLAVICNRNNVTNDMVGGVKINALLNMNLPSWRPEECPMCEQGIPINTELGHGAKNSLRS